MSTVLDRLREIALVRSKEHPDDLHLIRGLWRVDHRCRPNRRERLLNYTFVMAQTEHQGCCYADFGAMDIDACADRLINQDARSADPGNTTVAIALLDAVYAAFGDKPDLVHTIDGPIGTKAVRRAELVADEVLAQLDACAGRRVVNVGVIGNFVSELQRRQVDVVASDYDPVLLRDGINGVPVVTGDRSPELVERADVALVCGETITNGSLDEVLEAARGGGTRVIIYAVTGAHFAREYCQSFGVHAVISEPQPQYLFQGPTRLGVMRARSC